MTIGRHIRYVTNGGIGGLLFVFAIQDGHCKGNGIPSANQDIQVEVYFSGWKDYQIGKEYYYGALGAISLSGDL
jgi:hypothetical protein